MPKTIPIFYSAVLLTIVNLLLRFVGTSFQVYISNTIGAAGVGLLQLVMSVGGLSMVAAVAGIRTATMYLAAEELGRNRAANTPWVLSGCFLYSILCSTGISAALYSFSPQIAQYWIGDPQTVSSLRLFAGFLPVVCLCGVMTGYFTAANRIGTLAIVEVIEQLCSMAITMMLLTLWAGHNAYRACLCVVLGSALGSLVTLSCLIILRFKEGIRPGRRISVRSRLAQAAIPLAIADVLKAGINTTENLMVPRQLSRNPYISDPLAVFGMVSGMVFPILMFPACILFGLAELLIPELARCAAADKKERISYLVQRSLKVALLYGICFSGLLFLLAEPLCLILYNSAEAGKLLKTYTLLIPMLYCDAITDAMTKGLGQQKICVVFNIITSLLDVIFLYILLPTCGMEGYFFSFLVTHLLNFILSISRLFKITHLPIPFSSPVLAFSAMAAALWGASNFHTSGSRALSYLALLFSLLQLFRVIDREDFHWIQGILRAKK